MKNVDSIHTLVIKIGTSLLSGERAFEGRIMEAMVREICDLKRQHDMNVLIVSSGAVGCGMDALGMTKRPSSLPTKQAVAAVGQATLMHYYETLFLTHGDNLHTAQVLLNPSDLDDRRSYLNVRNTLHTLFDMKTVIPIVNENDSTAVQELCFGNNDTLAAKIAAKKNADLLILLSDVDGLYDKNPVTHPDATLIRDVHEITPSVMRHAGGAGTVSSTGGMRTKLEAARIAYAAGVSVVVANGQRDRIIHGVLGGSAPCTWFHAPAGAISHRKRWIAFGRTVLGSITVDEGAREALVHHGKSLLAAGITGVEGKFELGDAVAVRDVAGKAIGRGLVNYSSRDILRLRGCHSNEFEVILGRKDYDEVIHRDNLVLL